MQNQIQNTKQDSDSNQKQNPNKPARKKILSKINITLLIFVILNFIILVILFFIIRNKIQKINFLQKNVVTCIMTP
jgi:hypothetical protein